MLSATALPLIAILLALPGIPGLPSFGLKDLKKLRQKAAPPLDSLPPAWKPVSRLALENQFLHARLAPFPSGPIGLKLQQDPRLLRVALDSDSGDVRYVTQVGEFTIGEVSRVPAEEFTRQLTQRNFRR